VRASLARLLEHRNRERLAGLRLLQLREAQCRGKTGGTAADDEDVDVEGFAVYDFSNSAIIAGTTSNKSPTMP
jgi:hypothetical protein